ncbi:MAG: DNA topoisomerase (ATP-hydrolyzing) subunit A [Spirochaetia bacterium]|nr:DNA topoisomerase (ATP-hydrolyzing) subunit A [Spirochaetia bacterium]
MNVIEKEIGQRVIPIAIEDEMKESYLNYAMSVIVSRALPDVRDGLKPVHRRILYSMHEMGLRHDKAFKKCGRIVGDVLGKYHPHGDQSIYDALVRLAQDFSMRYQVVHPQGNFGSVDGDPPAAMRYTEAKMNRIAEEMLKDINKETIDYGPNYDDSMQEPLVLPASVPYLLVNGGSGIAVGMATNMAPHNMTEVCAAIAAYIDNPEITFDELCEIVKGPDFPTQGIIHGRSGIRNAYRTGKGKVVIRARYHLDTLKSGRDAIIVTELPYQVNKANLLKKIADLVRDKRVEGIADLRDESDRDGMRMVIELRRNAVPKVLINQLFLHTALETNFNINNLALVEGQPKLLSLKEMIHYYVRHRVDVVVRRTQYDLRKAEERAHILEGLKIALDNVDEVIRIIKQSESVALANENLRKRFGLSEIQAKAILDMRLQKLTSLETQRIIEELEQLMQMIIYYKDLLSSDAKILGVVRTEIMEVSERYGDKRKTEIVRDEVGEMNMEDLIREETVVIVVSNKGFVKRVPTTEYRSQGRGGKGSKAAKLRDNDFVEHLFITSTHDHIMFVTTAGKAYWIKAYELPEGTRTTKGSHLKAILAISPDEDVTAIVSFKDFTEGTYVFMGTSKGVVKKVELPLFKHAKTRGIAAIKLDEGDRLVKALLTDGNSEVMLISRRGLGLRFKESMVRAMGRATRGVSGMKLSARDEIAGILLVNTSEKILIITENGYGKKVDYDTFSPHARATKGQICYRLFEKTGEVAGALSLTEEHDFMCVTLMGQSIRVNASQIPVQGRNTGGVIISNIQAPDMVVSIASTEKNEEEAEEVEDIEGTEVPESAAQADSGDETIETPENEEPLEPEEVE